MLKNDFESMNFDIFEEVVHNFGRPDNDMTCEKMLIFNISSKMQVKNKIVFYTFH